MRSPLILFFFMLFLVSSQPAVALQKPIYESQGLEINIVDSRIIHIHSKILNESITFVYRNQNQTLTHYDLFFYAQKGNYTLRILYQNELIAQIWIAVNEEGIVVDVGNFIIVGALTVAAVPILRWWLRAE